MGSELLHLLAGVSHISTPHFHAWPFAGRAGGLLRGRARAGSQARMGQDGFSLICGRQGWKGTDGTRASPVRPRDPTNSLVPVVTPKQSLLGPEGGQFSSPCCFSSSRLQVSLFPKGASRGSRNRSLGGGQRSRRSSHHSRLCSRGAQRGRTGRRLPLGTTWPCLLRTHRWGAHCLEHGAGSWGHLRVRSQHQ